MKCSRIVLPSSWLFYFSMNSSFMQFLSIVSVNLLVIFSMNILLQKKENWYIMLVDLTLLYLYFLFAIIRLKSIYFKSCFCRVFLSWFFFFFTTPFLFFVGYMDCMQNGTDKEQDKVTHTLGKCSENYGLK